MNNYDDLIMSLLEERGLDKRFRDNPAAVSQICTLIKDDIIQKNGDSLQNSERSRIEETVRRILGEYDDVGNDGIRYNNFYSISEDGSLSVKHKTYVDKSGGYTAKTDSEQIFAIGKEKGDLIVTESSEYISQAKGDVYASLSVKFNIFNSNGLEIQSRDISQSVNVNTPIRIANATEAFKVISGRTLSPVTETILDRGADLATESFSMREINNCVMAFEKRDIIDSNKNKDAISNPIPISLSLGGSRTGKTKSGIAPNLPSTSKPDYLMPYVDAETWASKTNEEREAAIQIAYNVSAANSKAFRETLLDSAKTNPELQEVVKKLNLDRTANEKDTHVVNVGDLEKIYEGVSDKEHRTTMQTIIETSKEVDDEKESDKMEK